MASIGPQDQFALHLAVYIHLQRYISRISTTVHDGEPKKVLKRINQLVQDVLRNGNEGIGKPEPLKHDFAGYWSRRITDEHRLAYKLTDTEVRIVAGRYHYGR